MLEGSSFMQRGCGLIVVIALLAASGACGGIHRRPPVAGADRLQECREFLDRLDVVLAIFAARRAFT